MSLYAVFTDHVKTAVAALQKAGDLPENLPFENIVVEQPREAAHGDLATNAAMVLAKPAGLPPRAIAEKLLPHLSAIETVEQVEIAGPGFINLKLSPAVYAQEMAAMLRANGTYGTGTKKNETINVEYVSTNPTGPIHIGHGRNAVVGDALAGVLEKAGYTVQREYLMNDAGGQIRVLVNSVYLRYRELFGETIDFPEGAYPGEYVVDIATNLKNRDGDKWLHVTNSEEIFNGLRAFCVEACMTMIRGTLEKLGVRFDTFFSEFAMHERGESAAAVEQLSKEGFIYRGTLPPPKGKEVEDYEPVELTLFRSQQYGDDVDRPVYKSTGEMTYFGQDIAYHKNKISRGADRMINVWGADHAGAVKRLKVALQALTGRGDALEMILIQMVRLLRDGSPAKMSKRAGNFVTLDEVIDEVGADAVRFIMLTRKADTPFDFDMTRAVEKNNENPVFYVQYAHARMCSVFRQFFESGRAAGGNIAAAASGDMAGESTVTKENFFSFLTDPATASFRFSPHELALLRHLTTWPVIVEKAAASLEPHRIAGYAHQLAELFHAWYGAEKFIVEDDQVTTHRLALVAAAQGVLQEALGTLGVSFPHKM